MVDRVRRLPNNPLDNITSNQCITKSVVARRFQVTLCNDAFESYKKHVVRAGDN